MLQNRSETNRECGRRKTYEHNRWQLPRSFRILMTKKLPIFREKTLFDDLVFKLFRFATKNAYILLPIRVSYRIWAPIEVFEVPWSSRCISILPCDLRLSKDLFFFCDAPLTCSRFCAKKSCLKTAWSVFLLHLKFFHIDSGSFVGQNIFTYLWCLILKVTVPFISALCSNFFLILATRGISQKQRENRLKKNLSQKNDITSGFETCFRKVSDFRSIILQRVR